MRTSLLALAATLSVSSAQVARGFNYGAVTRDGAVKDEAAFTAEFTAAQGLPGTDGAFSSARLYTCIQAGTANSPISAFPAAIASDTRLFLGLWASSGATVIENEIAALTSAIEQYGEEFTSRVNGISVGSEDLYRISVTGLSNDPDGVGASPDVVASYIRQVKEALADTPLASTPVGHVDTWDVWRNGSNAAVIEASDFLGMNTFPYFQTTQENSIDNAPALFNDAYEITVRAANGKPVIITETGWPVSGEDSASAEPSTENARSYYEAVGCNTLFGNIETYWYTLVDANTATATQPQFGVVGTTVSTDPLFDLSCSADDSDSVSSSVTSATGSATGTAIPTTTASEEDDDEEATTTSALGGLTTSTRVSSGTSEVVVVPTGTETPTLSPEAGRPNNTVGVGGSGGNGVNGTASAVPTSQTGTGVVIPTTTGTGVSPSATFDGGAAQMKGSLTAGAIGAVAAIMAFA